MKWLQKKRAEILRRWRNNDISLAEAAALLHQTGIGPLAAWNMLQRT
jgi:hypothetical protein